MVNQLWSSAGNGPSEPLTFAKVQEAVRKLKTRPQPDHIEFTVHPLRWMLIERNCDPLYCGYLGRRLMPDWQSMYDQTFADYHGWGING